MRPASTYQTDRLVSGIRALNPGSTGMPRPPGQACWLTLNDRGRGDLTAEHRTVPYDAGAVADDLHHRRHPNAAYIGAVLTGQREQYRHPQPGNQAWMPQVCVTASPGCRTSRSSPVAKAFGGQVMGSTASALRRQRGSSGSPVNTCSQG